jgi:AraC-like DNA-binding protein
LVDLDPAVSACAAEGRPGDSLHVAWQWSDISPLLGLAITLLVTDRALGDILGAISLGKLEVEHASFTGVLDEARASAAKRMLEDPDRSIGQTAYALGFSEPSAFHRAFKRWTGMTPSAYRARL